MSISVFRKQTYTNLLLNFQVVCPRKWKTGLVYCMLHRVWLICSSQLLFDKECKTLAHIFSLNGYPHHFFNRVLSNFLINIAENKEKEDSENDQFILKIPYLGKCSTIFAQRMSSIIKEHYVIDILPVFTSF